MRVLDIFSGIGGFSLGLQRAGHTTIAFCECEDYAQAVLRKNFPDVPIFDDVRTLTADTFAEPIDIICGGFPCQDISIAGKNAGIDGERSGLWKQFKRLIDETRPKYALIENVDAILGRGLSVVLADLASIGYDATWATLDSKYFGLPQRRRRTYICAVRDGIPDHADLFDLGRRSDRHHRSAVDNFPSSRPYIFTTRGGRQVSYYTRQRTDQYAACGLASTLAKRDYKSATDLIVDGPVIRRVTPQERLLLQGFPADWFDGTGISVSQQYKCNGMSVPVVEWVGHNLTDFDRGYAPVK